MQAPELLQTSIATLLKQAKSYPSPLTALPLIGTMVDVTTHLKNIKDTIITTIAADNKVNICCWLSLLLTDPSLKAGILNLYCNAVLMARTPVLEHVTVSCPQVSTSLVSFSSAQ